MVFKIYKFLLLYSFLIISFSFGFAQSVNDYRSVATGNWNTVSIWEVFNGTTWVAATTYPGQLAGTNNVYIQSGFTVTLSSSIPNSYNSLTIGDGIGATDTFQLSGNANINTLLMVLANGSFTTWTGNFILTMPVNAIFAVQAGAILDTPSPCNANKIIVIGTNLYATCSGGGGDFSFSELTSSGGSINVSPSTNGPICSGNILNLSANPSGLGSDDPLNTYSWFGTGPSGYTFSSTLQDPTVILSIPGTYTYTVTITNQGIFTHTASVQVVVNVLPNAPVSDGNKEACSRSVFPTLNVSVGVGETVDWYDASTGGTLLLSNSTGFMPTLAGSYFAETRNTTTNCTSNSRTEVIFHLKICTVITNRKITIRAGKTN